MLGQRYTTPMITVVCPVTKLHHMASLQSASSCNCTSYAGIVLEVAEMLQYHTGATFKRWSNWVVAHPRVISYQLSLFSSCSRLFAFLANPPYWNGNEAGRKTCKCRIWHVNDVPFLLVMNPMSLNSIWNMQLNIGIRRIHEFSKTSSGFAVISHLYRRCLIFRTVWPCHCIVIFTCRYTYIHHAHHSVHRRIHPGICASTCSRLA